MTQDEMIELAKQAGWQYAHGESGFEPLWAFAKLVAEKEREACAEHMKQFRNGDEYGEFLAKLIRARGQVC